MLVKLIYRKYLKKSLSQVEYRFIIFFWGGGACYGLVTVVRNHCSQLRGRRLRFGATLKQVHLRRGLAQLGVVILVMESRRVCPFDQYDCALCCSNITIQRHGQAFIQISLIRSMKFIR